MSPEYLAGFFDGEGCVNLTCSGANGLVALRVMLVNTDYEFLKEIQYEYGGILTTKESKKNWKPFCQVRWNNNVAAHFLRTLLPHLRLKKRQAELALEFVAAKDAPGRLVRLGRTTHLTSVARNSDYEFKEKMHELNRKGRK